MPAIASSAGINKWTDEDGNVHYGQQAPTGQSAEKILVDKAPPEADIRKAQLENKMDEIKERSAELKAIRQKQISDLAGQRNKSGQKKHRSKALCDYYGHKVDRSQLEKKLSARSPLSRLKSDPQTTKDKFERDYYCKPK